MPYNMVIEEGSTFTLTFEYKPGGQPANLTGYSAKLRVVRDLGLSDQSYLLSFQSDGQGTPNTSLTLGGAAGTIAIRAEASVTSALKFTDAPYALLIESPDGTVTKVVDGSCSIVPGVSF